jgi:hypothetical protein
MHIGLPPMLTFHTVDKHGKMNNQYLFQFSHPPTFCGKNKYNAHNMYCELKPVARDFMG